MGTAMTKMMMVSKMKSERMTNMTGMKKMEMNLITIRKRMRMITTMEVMKTMTIMDMIMMMDEQDEVVEDDDNDEAVHKAISIRKMRTMTMMKVMN